MKKYLSIVRLLVTLILCVGNTYGQTYKAEWASLDQRKVPGWFSNVKFGIFIHWGLYSVPAWATDSYADGFGSNYAEWYWQRLNARQLKIHPEFVSFHERVYGKDFKYPSFAERFSCEMFDPVKWAGLFKKSGARYVVLTSKHHDGYCLWPSAQAWNWNSVSTGPGKDLVRLVTDAVRAAGLRMGLYYSLYEWYNPLYLKNVDNYVDQHMIPQIRDLVSTYQPDVLWFDGDWEHAAATWKTDSICAWIYNNAPNRNDVVINDRLGSDVHSRHGSFQTSEYGRNQLSAGRPWEETRGIGQSFGYNRNENLADYATSKELVHQLIQTVARGGNFLLNIGPAADGTIPVIMQQRLADIGTWLEVNGEAIYDTQPWQAKTMSYDSVSTQFYTSKGRDAYVMCTEWTPEIEITFPSRPLSVRLLGIEKELAFTYRKGRLFIKMPVVMPGKLPCEYAWVLKVMGKT
jgi:alpha-L-fucosidase